MSYKNKKSLAFITAITLLITLSMTPFLGTSTASSAFFDFESGTLTKWSGTTGTAPTIQFGNAYSGNYSLLASTWVSYAYYYTGTSGIADSNLTFHVKTNTLPSLWQQNGFAQIKDVDDQNTLLIGVCYNEPTIGPEWWIITFDSNGNNNMYLSHVPVSGMDWQNVTLLRYTDANYYTLVINNNVIINQTHDFAKNAGYFELGCMYCDVIGWTGNNIDDVSISSVSLDSQPTPTPMDSPVPTPSPTPTNTSMTSNNWADFGQWIANGSALQTWKNLAGK